MIVCSVGDLIRNQIVVSIDRKVSVMEACDQMSECDVGALIVTENGCMCGIVSERDVIRRCDAQGAPSELMRVEKIMTKDPVTIGMQDSIVNAMALMLEGGFHHLPVLGASGQVMGVLSMRDIPAKYRVMVQRNAAHKLSIAAE